MVSSKTCIPRHWAQRTRSVTWSLMIRLEPQHLESSVILHRPETENTHTHYNYDLVQYLYGIM